MQGAMRRVSAENTACPQAWEIIMAPIFVKLSRIFGRRNFCPGEGGYRPHPKTARRRIGRYGLSATGSQKPMIYPAGANGITMYSREHKRGIMGARQGMVTLR